jgi:hypothetical protein
LNSLKNIIDERNEAERLAKYGNLDHLKNIQAPTPVKRKLDDDLDV